MQTTTAIPPRIAIPAKFSDSASDGTCLLEGFAIKWGFGPNVVWLAFINVSPLSNCNTVKSKHDTQISNKYNSNNPNKKLAAGGARVRQQYTMEVDANPPVVDEDRLSLMPPEVLNLVLPRNIALRSTCRLLRDAYDTQTEHVTIDRVLDSHHGHTKCAEVVRRLRRSPGIVSLKVTKRWARSAWAEVLATMPVLRRLEAAKQPGIRLDVIAAAPCIELLDINECCVNDLAPLTACTSLRHLDMGWNDVTDLTPLAACTALQHLDMTGCSDIDDLGPLSACTSLRHLVIKQCRSVADLSPLAAACQLQHLDISNAYCIVDLAPLAACSALRHLDMTGCMSISDLSPLVACTELRCLVLNECWAVADIAPLAACTALQRLDLNGCWQVTDMTPLAALTALRSVNR